MPPSRDIQHLLDLMAALRAPGTGCAWDRDQTFETIAPYTVEEAYEVVDAIERGDMLDLKDELGDLLLQVVFHARIAQERGAFGFGDVVEAITSKLVRRHPHVFGDREAETAADVALSQESVTCGSGPEVLVDVTRFTPGGLVEVTVTCRARLGDLGLPGLPATKTLTATAASPVEQYRSQP